MFEEPTPASPATREEWLALADQLDNDARQHARFGREGRAAQVAAAADHARERAQGAPSEPDVEVQKDPGVVEALWQEIDLLKLRVADLEVRSEPFPGFERGPGDLDTLAEAAGGIHPVSTGALEPGPVDDDVVVGPDLPGAPPGAYDEIDEIIDGTAGDDEEGEL